MQYRRFFEDAINKKKEEQCYREFVNISRIEGQFPFAINSKNKKKITIWCSNDYLALGQNSKSINQAIKSLKKFGIGSGGTRNISGTNNLMVELEEKIAKLHQKESGLVFTSGYIANDSVIKTFGKIIPNLTIFSDEKNHASIISGIKGSNLKKKIFTHNDIAQLEKNLKDIPLEDPKMIIFQSIYSIVGDFAKIKDIVKLAKKYNALTYIDEVHSVGLYGDKGSGLANEMGLLDEIDILQGTFAKAFGAMGGYICAKKNIIDAIRLYASGFIFTTSLAPVLIGGIIENINLVSNEMLYSYQQRVKFIKKKLQINNIPIIENESHIISIKIGDPKLAQEISNYLLEEFNLYIQHINHPTVPRGQEMLRITVTPLHKDDMVECLLQALDVSLKMFNVI